VKCKSVSVAALTAVGLILGAGAASAATATGTFQSRITILAECQVVATNTLDFGTVGQLIANVDTDALFSVQCTNNTPYDIGLDAGTTAGGTTATRLMTDGSATVSYQMFSNAARTINWGNTVGTDTISDIGTGSNKSYTIFGRVPSQVTPAAATYTDTVTVTITY
jgi:spore coat protein U-like protein